jgi:hypothetical protein
MIFLVCDKIPSDFLHKEAKSSNPTFLVKLPMLVESS